MVRRPRTRTRALVLPAGLLALVVGCTGAASAPESRPGGASSTASRSAAPSPSASARVVALPDDVHLLSDSAEGAALAPGRYAGAFGVSARPAELPLAVVRVPSGYVAGGPGGVYSDEGGFRHLSLWTVSKVANDACVASVVYRDPGPTSRDLARALTALPVWRSSPPTPTTIGGYRGLVMDFDLPDPLPDTCGAEPEHWADDVGGTQGVGPGKRQRLWILDVGGQRVMILAGWFPAGVSDPDAGVTRARAKELLRMAETVTFLPSGA